jgi:4-aminobutyrate aminotransferase-like enzyme
MRVTREVTGRRGFVSLEDDFHGRTSSAASVSAGRTSNGPRDAETLIVPGGCRGGCRLGLDPVHCRSHSVTLAERAILQNLPGQLAGAVIEPVQNRNGATSYPAGYLAELAAMIRRHGGLLILDEIATGFGRTGTWFACEAEQVVPDVMAIGKGLGNGYPVRWRYVRSTGRRCRPRSRAVRSAAIPSPVRPLSPSLT